jgi:RNA polymerase sigma-70 factor (ECF subfamily)
MNRDSKTDYREIPDERLIREYLDGADEGAFDEILQRYQDQVFNLCFRMTGDYDDASDCAQEVFIKIYRKMDTFAFRARFMTWIYRIAINTCRNHLSSSHKRISRSSFRLDAQAEELLAGAGSDAGANDGVERSLERAETEGMVQEALGRLSPDLRALVILKDMEDRPYEEIALILKMRTGTVKSRLSRARRQLRNLLREVYADEVR